MSDIRYYRSGSDDEPRTEKRGGNDAPLGTPKASARPSARVMGAARRLATPRRLALVALAAAVVAAVLLGRQVFADAFVALSALRHVRRLPQWSPDAAVLVAGAAFALGAYALAFGRRRILMVLAVILLVALFATPGAALGWVSGSVDQMGRGGTAEQKATVSGARAVLQRPLPDRPLNILLLGIDHAGPGDPGRSDSQILVRLDPQAKTISMLSLPRDLRWDVPGVGYTKMNAAYTYGGVKLAVKTFSAITGLPINHFIRVDFGGFWHIVDILHGVYLPIDHRYLNREGNGFQPIDLLPGYQLVRAKQALAFVRFRHDQEGDFTRMVRQQLFLREVQRQAMRWNGSWTTVVRMVREISRLTTTDLDSLSRLLPVVNMALSLDTSRIYQVHVQGSTPTIGGVSYVVASPGAIAKAVREFQHPPLPQPGPGVASATTGGPGASRPARTKPPAPSISPVASGGAAAASHGAIPDLGGWRALARRTSLTIEAPTTWAPGLGLDAAGIPFRAYSVQTPQGRHVKAAIAVGTATAPSGVTEYWGVQALKWRDPPAIANPSSKRTIGGRTYLLFSDGGKLHMVAWQENGATYWVINTLDNVLSNRLMLALATSSAPVKG